jgi:hypothetical protein
MIDCIRDNELPQYYSSEQEKLHLLRDLQTFGPFRGIKGYEQLTN